MRNTFACGVVVALLAACGGSDEAPPPSPYTSDAGHTVVVGDGKGGTVYATPAGSDCVRIASGECVKPQERCGANARADVIVDSSGKVLEIVCYPTNAAPTPVDGDGNVDIGNGNKAVVAIDGNADGVDVAGSVTSTGNNVTVYGQGPDVSVVGKNVSADGNNFAMRGVRVKGDVTIKGNDAVVLLSVIEGNLTITGNNAVVAETAVLGTVTIVGNNAKLVGNRFAKGVSIQGDNAVCDGNVTWTDANGNVIVDSGETGAAVTCGGKGKK